MNTRYPNIGPLKAVIFDLDGVIFDSQEANVAFYNHLLSAMDLPPMDDSSHELVHSQCLEDSLMHLMGSVELVAKTKAYFRTMDPAPFLDMLNPFDQAIETIRSLAGRLRLAVATNRMDTTRRALAHVGLDDIFEAVVTPIEARATKPDPAMMHMVLDRLGLEAADVVYVGDSKVDADMCRDSSVRLIAFRNPALEAWAHVDDYPSLAALLG